LGGSLGNNKQKFEFIFIFFIEGDIMMVEAGDIINVDGILIETNDLKVNESVFISGREYVPK